MLYLIRAKRKSLADDMLENIRLHKRTELEYQMRRGEDELKKVADLIEPSELTEGHKYTYFGYSPMANAWRGNKLLPYNGEVYLYAGIFRDGALQSQTAWGGITITKLKDEMLLIED